LAVLAILFSQYVVVRLEMKTATVLEKRADTRCEDRQRGREGMSVRDPSVGKTGV